MVKPIKTGSSGVGPLKLDGKLISNSWTHAKLFHHCAWSHRITEITQNDKATSPDGIVGLPRLLFEFSEQIAPPLTFIFNKSIESGLVPENWRQANVAPIFKKGEKYKPSNDRPVSL